MHQTNVYPYEFYYRFHVKCVPCQHGMARPQVADGGEGLQIWRVVANILNKQSRTADKGWPSSLGVGRGITTPHRKKRNTSRNVTHLEPIQNNWTENVKCSSFIFAIDVIFTSEFLKNNNNAGSGFTLLKKKRDGLKSAKKGGGMILRLLKGRGMVSGLFEKKRDAIPPHPAPPQALQVLQSFVHTRVQTSIITLKDLPNGLLHTHKTSYVRFQVLTAASMKMSVFWDVPPCSLQGIDRSLRGSYCFHHQNDRTDNGGSNHLCNVGKFLRDYIEQHPRRKLSSRSLMVNPCFLCTCLPNIPLPSWTVIENSCPQDNATKFKMFGVDIPSCIYQFNTE
jgi:hypothetical protein